MYIHFSFFFFLAISLSLSLYLSIFVYPSICLSVFLSTPSLALSLLSLYLSLFTHLSVYLPTYMSFSLPLPTSPSGVQVSLRKHENANSALPFFRNKENSTRPETIDVRRTITSEHLYCSVQTYIPYIKSMTKSDFLFLIKNRSKSS